MIKRGGVIVFVLALVLASAPAPAAAAGAKETVEVLINSLDPNGQEDEIWQAAYSLGALGSSASAATPVLRSLLNHPSGRVRRYAKDALEAIS